MTSITYRNQTIERLEAENKALRATLQPFANAAKNLIKPDSLDYSVEDYGVVEKPQGDFLGVSEIYIRDLRRAAATLEAAQANALEPGEGE